MAFLVAMRLLISDFFSMDIFFSSGRVLTSPDALVFAQRMPNPVEKVAGPTPSRISNLQLPPLTGRYQPRVKISPWVNN
jgi:hypothetical protein